MWQAGAMGQHSCSTPHVKGPQYCRKACCVPQRLGNPPVCHTPQPRKNRSPQACPSTAHQMLCLDLALPSLHSLADRVDQSLHALHSGPKLWSQTRRMVLQLSIQVGNIAYSQE